MAIRTRDLMKVDHVPEVRAAIEAQTAAMAASREAHRAWREADRLVDQRSEELEAVATRALANEVIEVEAWCGAPGVCTNGPAPHLASIRTCRVREPEVAPGADKEPRP